MYLSRVELDERRRATMRALAAPQKLHGAVESAFPGGRRRRLWRLDRLNGRLYLRLLSEDRPCLAALAQQFGAEGSGPETRDYTPLLERIAPGGLWQFRLTANPTHSCPQPGARGRVAAHCTADYQCKWLLDRAEKHGFVLTPGSFTVTNSRWLRFAKEGGRRPVSLLAVTYEGVLEVADPDLFRQTLTQGLGRGKAYGMGLLTVMRRG